MNTEIKNAFMAYILSETREDRKAETERTLKRIFRYVEEYENRYNKDAAYFTTFEIADMFKEKGYVSHYTCLHENKYLLHYTNFYAKQTGEEPENAYSLMTTEMFRECVARDLQDERYITSERMHTIVSEVLNAYEKAVILLLWDGISAENILYLTEDQVDYDNGTLNIGDETFEISEETLEILPQAFRQNVKIGYSTVKQQTRNIDGVGHIYKRALNARGEDSPNKRTRWLQNMMQTIRTSLNLKYLSAEQIRDSAMLNDFKIAAHDTGKTLDELLSCNIGKDIINKYYKKQITAAFKEQILDRFEYYM